MIYRCKSCGHEEARGCLPSATCGIYMLALVGLWLGIIAAEVPRLIASRPRWWAWLLIVPGSLLIAIIGGVLLDFALQLVEWAAFVLRRCPQCRRRRWSWGFTRGFGL
jgi:hypothetical protein